MRCGAAPLPATQRGNGAGAVNFSRPSSWCTRDAATDFSASLASQLTIPHRSTTETHPPTDPLLDDTMACNSRRLHRFGLQVKKKSQHNFSSFNSHCFTNSVLNFSSLINSSHRINLSLKHLFHFPHNYLFIISLIMASSPNSQSSYSQRSNTSMSSARRISSTPLRRSSRPPTPRKTIPGMIQPSADSRTTISLPQQSTSGSSRVQMKSKKPQKNRTSSPGLDSSQQSAPAPRKKRKRSPSKSSQVSK